MEKESKIRTKIDLIDSIILASYYLFCLLLFLSLAGLFKKELIMLGLAAGFLFWFWVEPKIELIKSKKQYLYFFIFIPILFIGILLVKGCFNGDGINYWLPWAREIVLQEKMPDFLLNSRSWLTSRMPLMPLFYAGIFSFLGFRDWVVAILPIFFAAATVFLMYRWLLEKGVAKNYIILGTLLLITSPLFLNLGGEAAQESFALFFFTAFFYYLEKFLTSRSAPYFLLAFLSAVLAVVSKETGLILFLPLGWIFIKNKLFKRPYSYLLFLIFPLLIWLFRNYLIYDNPLFPFLNELFKGRYYNLISTVNQLVRSAIIPFWNDILARIIEIPVSLFLSFFPLGILSFYGFFKKRKIQYILLFFIFLLSNLLVMAGVEYVRYCLPFLVVFIVYGVVGLAEMKSRIFLSFIFFLNLWGLFSTKLSLSQSQFISPMEGILNSLGWLVQFIHVHQLALALVLGLFFFFLVSAHKQAAKYLILLSVFTYLVKTESFNLGSWLNIWLPILALIFIILVWRLVIRFRLKEEMLVKLIVGYVVILLMLNSWGLAATYFLAHRNFVFPNFAEAYGAQPEAAREIEKLEGTNRDFYVFASTANYFTWYHNLKTIQLEGYSFHVITNLQYRDNLNPSEIHSLFKKNNIKYVVENIYRIQLAPFFDKIRSSPDLFELIFQKEGVSLWQVKI